jgi:hypothetical protein
MPPLPRQRGNMIISQTPLRVSFAGGGTDFARYYREHEGAVVSSAIDKYVYVVVVPRFDELIIVNYSKKETVENVRDLKHELVREAMLRTGVENGVEITTLADVPSEGSGLGSSSTVTVGLLHALYTYKGTLVTAGQLAREACEIEIDICGKPIGKQDQYIAAYGGICQFTFSQGRQRGRAASSALRGAVPRPVPQHHAVLHRAHAQSGEHFERAGSAHGGQSRTAALPEGAGGAHRRSAGSPAALGSGAGAERRLAAQAAVGRRASAVRRSRRCTTWP